jgi:hypothetical protein
MIGNSIAGFLGTGVAASTSSYESIATFTLASSGTVTFSSIPGTYSSLQLRYIARSARTGATTDELAIRLNSDSGSNYARHRLSGDGATASATGQASQVEISYNQVPTADSAASIFGAGIIDILDYADTSKNKTVRSLNGYDSNGTGQVRLTSGLWMNNTTAITGITILSANSANLAQYSSFTLYGIKG